MIGIYLSGTGNTKHCIERLVKLLDQSAKTIPLENRNIISEIKNNDTIILGCPAMGAEVLEETEFQGNSHEKITREVYSK